VRTHLCLQPRVRYDSRWADFGHPRIEDRQRLTMLRQPTLTKWSEHGLGHLCNPTDLDSDDRRWIPQVWLNIVRRALGLRTRSLPIRASTSTLTPPELDGTDSTERSWTALVCRARSTSICCTCTNRLSVWFTRPARLEPEVPGPPGFDHCSTRAAGTESRTCERACRSLGYRSCGVAPGELNLANDSHLVHTADAAH
jgi:hypothetical protein